MIGKLKFRRIVVQALLRIAEHAITADEKLDRILKGETKMGQALQNLQTALTDFITVQTDFDAEVELALAKLVPVDGGDTVSAADAATVADSIRQATATSKAERDKVAAALAALATDPGTVVDPAPVVPEDTASMAKHSEAIAQPGLVSGSSAKVGS